MQSPASKCKNYDKTFYPLSKRPYFPIREDFDSGYDDFMSRWKAGITSHLTAYHTVENGKLTIVMPNNGTKDKTYSVYPLEQAGIDRSYLECKVILNQHMKGVILQMNTTDGSIKAVYNREYGYIYLYNRSSSTGWVSSVAANFNAGVEYTFRLEVDNGTIRVKQNGNLLKTYADKAPLGSLTYLPQVGNVNYYTGDSIAIYDYIENAKL